MDITAGHHDKTVIFTASSDAPHKAQLPDSKAQQI